MNKWYENPGDDSDVVLSTHVSLSRNLDGVPFPARMSLSDRRAVWDRIRSAAQRRNSSVSGRFAAIGLEDVSELEAVSFAERGLISADAVSRRTGGGLLMTADESLSAEVNGEDHLLIRAQAAGLCMEKVYAAADGLDTFFGHTLPISFDPQLGFLTQNPFRLGTGMIVSLRLHLPALRRSGSLRRISRNLSKLGLSLHGVHGPEAEPLGAVYRLVNRVTLGISEREAIANLSSMAGQIIDRERELQKTFAADLGFQDTVWRDLGILRNARLLSYREFMERAGEIRAGIVAGLVRGIGIVGLDSLAVRVRPATLALENGCPCLSEKGKELRARLVRGMLSPQREDSDGTGKKG